MLMEPPKGGTLKVAPGKTASLNGKLSKAGLKRLLKAGQLKATIVVTGKVPSGETTLGKLAAKLVPKKQRCPPGGSVPQRL